MKRERMPIAVKRVGNRLVPTSRFDEKLLMEQPEGAMIEVTIARKRSLPQLRKYWAILNEVVDAAPCNYPTPEHLHSAIKLALGYTTDIITMDGEIAKIPDSVAFDKMDGKAFGEYFERAIELLNRLTGTDVLGQVAA